MMTVMEEEDTQIAFGYGAFNTIGVGTGQPKFDHYCPALLASCADLWMRTNRIV